MNECRAVLRKSFAYLIHQVDGITDRRGSPILKIRMAPCQEYRHRIFHLMFFRFRNGRTCRRKHRRSSIRGGRRNLNTSIGIGLVIIHHAQNFMPAIEHRRHGLQPDVRTAAVTGHYDNIWIFVLNFSFFYHHPEGFGNT
nr:hypothetical protein SPACI_52330 [Sporomusa acidovorans DSM 3132]